MEFNNGSYIDFDNLRNNHVFNNGILLFQPLLTFLNSENSSKAEHVSSFLTPGFFVNHIFADIHLLLSS